MPLHQIGVVGDQTEWHHECWAVGEVDGVAGLGDRALPPLFLVCGKCHRQLAQTAQTEFHVGAPVGRVEGAPGGEDRLVSVLDIGVGRRVDHFARSLG